MQPDLNDRQLGPIGIWKESFRTVRRAGQSKQPSLINFVADGTVYPNLANGVPNTESPSPQKGLMWSECTPIGALEVLEPEKSQMRT
jgi:hypothetical protein